VVLFPKSSDITQYPFSRVSEGEIDMSFQFRYIRQVSKWLASRWPLRLQYQKAIRLVSEGLVNILPLVTHNVPLAEAVSAFNVAADPSQGAIKVHIVDN
jgi:L-iditol 2-dehydrogenase